MTLTFDLFWKKILILAITFEPKEIKGLKFHIAHVALVGKTLLLVPKIFISDPDCDF